MIEEINSIHAFSSAQRARSRMFDEIAFSTEFTIRDLMRFRVYDSFPVSPFEAASISLQDVMNIGRRP